MIELNNRVGVGGGRTRSGETDNIATPILDGLKSVVLADDSQMSVADMLDLHGAAIQALAARYRQEGFEVVAEPSASELPDALRPFRPDLLARRGDETVMVEIKTRRPKGEA